MNILVPHYNSVNGFPSKLIKKQTINLIEGKIFARREGREQPVATTYTARRV